MKRATENFDGLSNWTICLFLSDWPIFTFDPSQKKIISNFFDSRGYF